MAFHAVSGFVIASVKLCALAVMMRAPERQLQQAQGVYRANLALTNFLAGAIILPAAVYTGNEYLIRAQATSVVGNQTARAVYAFFAGDANIDGAALLDRGPVSPFGRGFVDTIGFFSFIVIYISLYTLLACSVDRLLAVSKPMLYRTVMTKYTAVAACLFMWLVAAVYAMLPFFLWSLTDNSY